MKLAPSSPIPPPSPQAQMAIADAIDCVRRGDQRTAIRLLEGSFSASSPLQFAASDLRILSRALGEGKNELFIDESPMRYDWLYYASAALKLGIASQCSDKQFREAIHEFTMTQPTLNETGWLVERYATLKNRRETSLYQAILAQFHNGLANLKFTETYQQLRTIAFDLAEGDFPYSKSEAASGYGRSHLRFGGDKVLQGKLADAYDAYGRGDLDRALNLAEALVLISEEANDPWSWIDASHVAARVLFDRDQMSHAEKRFLSILDRAEQISYEEAFVRALHEISRLKSETYEVFEAEAGFRVVLDYYTARVLRRQRAGESVAPNDTESKNLQFALNCLGGLAETYFLLSGGRQKAGAC